jgi:hypothetical protein
MAEGPFWNGAPGGAIGGDKMGFADAAVILRRATGLVLER